MTKQLYIGNNPIINRDLNIKGDYVTYEGETYYRISNCHLLRPFFMSIVSDSDHWMFISSNGSLSAGRKNSDHSLFPYYTDDKITESVDITGSKSIFLVEQREKVYLWEPFTTTYKGTYKNISRNIYKNYYGNKILFEEINEDLGLSFSYSWNTSSKFGFVKKSKITNLTSHNTSIKILDGIQNILPSGISENLQNLRSNLVDAYKQNELDEDSGLGFICAQCSYCRQTYS